ncbi:neurofilament light polypeptide [Engraulis encrasicolus]|uniref:neurofilament light polypeptide n=1 Tax=Engraulis encrasicolus TaxID=184585 RepID=UPI002FD59AB2
MAARVSSYRRLFEEQQQQLKFGVAVSSARGGAASCPWDTPDFQGASSLNKESASRFAQERTVIAALNDRLAALIGMARCLEEENESLEVEILELMARNGEEEARSKTVAIRGPPAYSLEAVIERLRREKEEIERDTECSRKELAQLKAQYDQVAEQHTLIQLEKEDVAVDVDAITGECLGLREQVTIYEDQIASMEQQQDERVMSLSGPAPGAAGGNALVALDFPGFDISSSILDIKAYYAQLAQSMQRSGPSTLAAVAMTPRDLSGVPRDPWGPAALQPRSRPQSGQNNALAGFPEAFGFESRSSARAITAGAAAGAGAGAKAAGAAAAKDVYKVTDPAALKALIAELQKELAALERRADELEAEIEARKEAYLLEIEELEDTKCELRESQVELEAQMRIHCGDYDELLSQKMALDIEIAAYRGLVEEEEERLYCL